MYDCRTVFGKRRCGGINLTPFCLDQSALVLGWKFRFTKQKETNPTDIIHDRIPKTSAAEHIDILLKPLFHDISPPSLI